MRRLAARAKVDFSYVSKLEHGLVGAPTARQLWKIARALDIEVADLYSEAGFVDAHGLPGFAPYLRAKYQLPDEAISQLLAHFALINEKYHADANGDARRVPRWPPMRRTINACATWPHCTASRRRAALRFAEAQAECLLRLSGITGPPLARGHHRGDAAHPC